MSEACCPPLTSCSDDYNTTKDALRCNIRYASLMLLDVQSTITTSTSTSTTSFVISSTSTSLIPRSTLTQDPNETTSSAGGPQLGQGLSSGGIAGTVIGAVAGVAIAGAVAYYFVRRRWIAKYGNPNDPSRNSDKGAMPPQGNLPVMYPGPHTQPQEMSPEHAPTRYELSANR